MKTQMQTSNTVTFFGIPIYRTEPKDFITRITTSNWNKYQESIGLRKNDIVKNIATCKCEKTLDLLRNDLVKISEEQESFCNSHVIDD